MESNGNDSPVIKRERSRSPIQERAPDKERRSRGSNPSGRSRSRNRSRERNSRRDATKRVYVANIAYDCKWTDVKDLFREKIGDVAFVELFDDESGKFRGCGIVEMKDPASVDKAVEILHRYEYKGRQLVVKEDYDVERDKYGHPITRSSRNSDRDRPLSLNDSYHRNRDGGSGDRGGGRNREEVPYNNFGLNPDFLASLGISGPLSSKVFVANLEYKVDAKKLEEVFACAGTVVHVDLKTDQDGNSKGHAVVEFAHPIEAVQAISMLNGQKLFTRSMNMRMDRYVEESDRSSGKLPSGLQGLGKGLGVDGQPLHLSRLNSNMMGNNSVMPGSGPSMTPNSGAALGLLGSGGLSGLAGMGGLGASPLSAGGMGLGGLGLGLGGGLGSNAERLLSSALVNNSGMNASSVMGSSLGGGGLSSLGSGSAGMVLGSSGGGGAGGIAGLGGIGMGITASSMMSQNMSSAMGGNNSMPSLNSGGGSGGYTSTLNSSGSLGGGGGIGGINSSSSGYNSSSYNNERNAPDPYRSPRSSDTILIRNLPSTLSWQNLKDKIREIGEVRFAEVKGRGTAVVRFNSEQDAQHAVDLMHNMRVDNRTIEVRLY